VRYNTPMHYLESLNEKQKEAVLYENGPLLIVAGAGAGKTKTITHRIIHLIHKGIEPNSILAVTFTNKAAKEMRDRVMTLLDERVHGSSGGVPFISTFHSLGVHIIKENAHLIGLTKHFAIADEHDALVIIKDSMKLRDIDPKQHEPRKIKSVISKAKGDFITSSTFAQNASSAFQTIVAMVWRDYEQALKKERALDFDDLLLETVLILKKYPEIKKMYQDSWKYVHIDEYQDTNEVQYEMTKLLVGPEDNICVVGDTDQCLVSGTKITMADGKLKPIEKVRAGDFILSNYGSGDFRKARVTKTKSVHFSGQLIEIKTQRNKTIVSSPEHVHFAGYRLGTTPQLYFNYLMYKKDTGWRIGTTCVYTKGQLKPIVGFVQRSNQEHADALWIIATHKTEKESRVQEYIFSLKYRLPTIPFTPRKNRQNANGYVHDKIALEQIFNSFNTEASAKELLSDLGLSYENPHHRPQGSDSRRLNINITLCADRRADTPMHLISMVGNNEEIKRKLQTLGMSVRPAKKGSASWRFETVRKEYGEVYVLALKIAACLKNTHIVFKARLGGMKENSRDGNSLPFTPASNIMPGMALFTKDGYDIVTKVTKIKTPKVKMYDLDIENTHNFIANSIVTHNCIYSWRGANIKNIIHFEKDYPRAKIVLLEQNYRSTKNIISAANAVIEKNQYRMPKTLFTENTTGDLIGLYEAYDEIYEAEFVADMISELLQKNKPEDIAILYRANFQSRILEEALLGHGIPYQVLGVKFFERKEVKDVLSYIHAAYNRESLSDIKRIINTPTRGIGKVTMVKLFANLFTELPAGMQIKINKFYTLLQEIKIYSETHKPSETVKYVIEHSGIEAELIHGTSDEQERLENMRELVTLATKYDIMPDGAGLEKLLEDASLSSDQDTLMHKGAGVRMMTVHAAKGLEFPYVFVTGMEQDLFPHSRNGSRSKEDQEEERRLFYVALTRARLKLYLSYAQMRTIFGMKQINTPSEFLNDIPAELTEVEQKRSGGRERVVYL
jgi:DNA helicase-2/ATP-dependent DNA helicase PcrA